MFLMPLMAPLLLVALVQQQPLQLLLQNQMLLT